MRQIFALHIIIKQAVLLGTALLFFSCSIEETEELGELKTDFSSRTILDAHLTYKDSGAIMMELKAPIIEEFEFIDSPYTLMKKGLNVKFWNTNNPKENFLRADWAKVKDRQKFYEGRGNVLMINNVGDTLRTNHIFWDSEKQRIYTQDTVTIKRLDGTTNIARHGMNASQDFREFTFYSNSGIMMVTEEGTKPSPLSIPPKTNATDSIQNPTFELLETPKEQPKK